MSDRPKRRQLGQRVEYWQRRLLSGVQAQEAEEMRLVTEAALATPKGQKKDFSTEMPKTYDPMYVEAAMCGPCNAASPAHCLQ
jgi:hypothetical protein